MTEIEERILNSICTRLGFNRSQLSDNDCRIYIKSELSLYFSQCLDAGYYENDIVENYITTYSVPTSGI